MFIKTFASALVLAVFSTEIKAIQIEALLAADTTSKNFSVNLTNLQCQHLLLQLNLKLVTVDAQANTETQVRTPVFGITSSFVTTNTIIVMNTGQVTYPKLATFAATAVEMEMKLNPKEDSENVYYQYTVVTSVLNFVRL